MNKIWDKVSVILIVGISAAIIMAIDNIIKENTDVF